jgi:hypothetical protein
LRIAIFDFEHFAACLVERCRCSDHLRQKTCRNLIEGP